MIQILSGTFRHRRLILPKGDQTRPTTSQMRQAVFNILQHDVVDSSFLDICAGSGSMGIEALSRGASHATFIDSSHFAIQAVGQNIKTLALENVTDVLSGDAVACLKRLQRVYTLVYFDPPYTQKEGQSKLTTEVLTFLDTSSILAPGALILMEESAQFSLDTLSLTRLQLKNRRRFGNSHLYELVS